MFPIASFLYEIRKYKCKLSLKELRMHWFILACLIIPTSTLCQNFSKFQTDTVTAAGTKFLLYLPIGYNPQNTHPLLVSLHGAASIGNALSLILTQVSHRPPARLIMDNKWPTSNPMMVLSPQLKRDSNVLNQNDQEWPLEVIDEVIEYVKSKYSVNNNKVYLTGISLGAAAVWEYAANYPAKVAAINPMSGLTNLNSACNLKDIPIWAFHGSDDLFVIPSFSVDMINEINNCGLGNYKPKLNLLQTRQHDVWNNVWNGEFGFDVFNWMLQFTKNNNANIAPYVKVDQNLTVKSRAGRFYLNSDVFDWDGEIVSTQWSQISGPSLSYTQENNFLRINELPSGIYNFQLSVKDNSGSTTIKTVKLEVKENAGSGEAEIVGMVLVNGATNQNILPITESLVINKSLLNISEFNIKAIGNTNTQSVRFAVNTDKNIFVDNFPFNLIKPRNTTPEWEMDVGDYSVCAVPCTLQYGGGSLGISQCFKLSVFDQPIVNYYAKPNSDISKPSSWGTLPGGLGSSPDSLTCNFAIFNTNSQGSIDDPLVINGVESKLVVKSGSQLLIQSNFTGIISAEENSTVHISTNQKINLGTIHPNSHFIFSGSNSSIPKGTYGNVSLIGGGAMNFEIGETIIMGNLTCNGVELKGSLNNSSKLKIYGDVDFTNTSSTLDYEKISIELLNGIANQSFTINSNLVLHQLQVSNSANVSFTAIGYGAVSLGSANGGGLIVSNQSSIDLSNCSIEITGMGNLNSSNQSSEIGLDNSNLIFSSLTTSAFNLYPMPGKNSIETITYNSPNSQGLVLQNHLNVKKSIEVISGLINSNGFIKLLSSDDNDAAYVKKIKNGGQINGEVTVQRHMSGEGRIWRYISSSVVGAAISQLQDFFPVSGTFNGASNEPSLSSNPSLFYYDENLGLDTEGWQPYPAPDGDNQAILVNGKGYTSFIREAIDATTYELTGELVQGNFNFHPTGGTTSQSDGWNLVGNPYASSIKWDPINLIGWNLDGVTNSVYVRDNGNINPRFLWWDGEVGNLVDGIIASGQAFWIQTNNSSPQLSISEDAKYDGPSATFYRSRNNVQYITAKLSNGLTNDIAFIKFVDVATDQYQKSEDTYKRANDYLNLSSLSTDSIRLAINTINDQFCDKAITFEIDDVDPGEYDLIFDVTNYNGIFSLYDNQLQESIQLHSNNVIHFVVTADPRSYQHRFILAIKKENIFDALSITLPEVCQQDVAKLTIENSQTNVQYYIRYDDLSTSGPYFGTGMPVTIQLDQNRLNIGHNSLDIFGEYETCGLKFIMTIEFERKDFIPFNPKKDYLTVCRGEDVSLNFDPLPNGAFYRLYTDSTFTFYTDLDESYVQLKKITNSSEIYVSTIGPDGCESPIASILIMISQSSNPELKVEDGSLISSYLGENQWYLNHTLISEASNPIYTPIESGEYMVSYIDGECIKYSNAVTFLVTEVKSWQGSISIFPNPTKNDILNISGNFDTQVEISIYGTNGTQILKQIIDSPSQKCQVELPLNLSTGLYLIILKGKDKLYKQMFSIQR